MEKRTSMVEGIRVKASFDEHPIPSEERGVQQTLLPAITDDTQILERISSYSHLMRVRAWILRFVNNARKRSEGDIVAKFFPCQNSNVLKRFGGGLLKDLLFRRKSAT